MANHASHAALPYPIKNARYTIEVPYLDADGDPTDPTSPDSEVSIDNGAFADCAEEVSLASGSRGGGILSLSGAETDGSCVKLWLSGAGVKATMATLYPRVLPVLFSGTAQAGAGGSITLATDVPALANLLLGCIVKTTGGTGGGGTGGANNQARVITGFSTGRVASVSPNWETAPGGTTTYEILLTEAAYSALANVIQWNGAAPNNLSSGRVESHVAAMANDVVTAAAMAADAGTEIADTLLKRDMSAVSGEAARSMLNALRVLRNKVAEAGGTLTVYKEDDSTPAFTAAVTFNAAAYPIVAVDPT